MAIGAIQGCKKLKMDEGGVTENSQNQLFARPDEPEIPYNEGRPIILGERGPNPYAVKMMGTAWEMLAAAGIRTVTEAHVHATHYYVRFNPINDEQYEALHSDSSMWFSDIPIETEVLENGDYYHDPELPDSMPTYQYTAVPVNFRFPEGIRYEILDELYIPETDPEFSYENGGIDDRFVDQLLNQVFEITGHPEDIYDLSEGRNQTSRYTPGGQIRVNDTRLQQYIGMQGVRVQARRWFTIYNAYPDYFGYYRMNGSFKRPCNYSIWFATPTFAVRHNLVNTTFWINGPKKKGDWNYDLNNSYQRFAGHVFRGAFRYHFRNIGGLMRPWILPRRQIYVAKDGSKSWSGVNWIVLPVIRIARYNSRGTEYTSDEIFSTTCHETGHTSHVLRMNAGVIQYWQVTTQLQESWPIAIEWFLTHMEYEERGISNYGWVNYNPTPSPQYPNRNAYQYWNLSVDRDYTSLYINIIDKENDQVFYSGSTIPKDLVTGYTLPFIEQRILKHSYGLSSLSTQLKANKPSGITDSDIDLLLSYY
jgi:hypothetical protein